MLSISYISNWRCQVITVVNIKHYGQRLENVQRAFPNAKVVYCGRAMAQTNWIPGPFANNVGKGMDRDAAIEAFRHQLLADIHSKKGMYPALMEMVGLHLSRKDIVLVCWCKPAPCHADVVKLTIENMAR